MKQTYSQWIEDYRKSVNGEVGGKCHAACKAMLTNFPNLKMVRGYVQLEPDSKLGNSFPHWWLEDLDTKDIVDPTASQFPFILGYVPHNEDCPEPTGKCPNCGDYCYGGKPTCSEKCEIEYMAYLSGCLKPNWSEDF